ncbi:hypothetical protein [Variovorax sp. RA8]|uniref:hypothetical protein n=1 Tax=Variovorax sp. (strain JCM 16519 / RA8) TaxID=662548 RepID=UPI001318361E|nr:hypothetical protein [Variovorax sp. RA8]VTU33053.1 hypothetical protein RA8CHR_04686 [Variovorax sp. RA8]
MTDPQSDPPLDAAPVETAPPSHPSQPAARASFWRWIGEGLRAAFLLPPRIDASPTPWQLLILVLVPGLLALGVARLQIEGPASFHPLPALQSFWATALSCGSAGGR